MTIGKYLQKDIFNADETGLFFKCLPSKTLHPKGEKCHNGEKSKERVTILFTCSQIGEKLRPLVIGKSAKPRCFNGLNSTNFGVFYRNNKSAWMTEILWNEWLVKIDKHFREQQRNILLFVDNFSAHLKPPHMTNIKIIFFPANCTSKLQPLDQGIIACFKRYYKSTMLDRLIQSIDDEIEIPQINIKNAIDLTVKSWNQVSDSCIRNCFRKSGFTEEVCEAEDHFVVTDNTIAVLKERGIIANDFNFEDYVSIDNDLSIGAQNRDEDIEKAIQNINRCV